jgi:hypothetical protein
MGMALSGAFQHNGNALPNSDTQADKGITPLAPL